MADIVILGGGFGGLTAARLLREQLPRTHRVVLVERSPYFLMGLAKLWALDGRRPLSVGRRAIASLTKFGIDVMGDSIQRIDPKERTVQLAGKSLRYDHLIIALGAELTMAAIPGFDAALNLYEPSSAERIGAELRAFEGGRILFVIGRTPVKCPPAPYEAAMLTSSLLERRGVRAQTKIDLTTPEPRPLPVAPVSCGDDLQGYLKTKGIGYHPNLTPSRVRAGDRRVEYEGGVSHEYDLLVGVPVHRPPKALEGSGLGDASGWIPVDPRTLRTQDPRVFAVGDVTTIKTPSGRPLPKAGVFAETQARVVAANLVAELSGRPSAATFEAKGQCYIELGGGVATAVEGDFYATPEPNVTLRMPTQDALREKERFEQDHLRFWFGA